MARANLFMRAYFKGIQVGRNCERKELAELIIELDGTQPDAQIFKQKVLSLLKQREPKNERTDAKGN